MKIKIIIISIFLGCLFSCKKEDKSHIQFDQIIQYKKDTVFYTFIIKNISDKSLLIIVPNNYYQAKDCYRKHFLFDFVPDKIDTDFFCSDSVINNFSTIEHIFTSYHKMQLNDSLLIQKLLKSIKVDLKEDMEDFLNPTQWNYPIFLFVKANSEIHYKYYTAGLFPRGKYILTFDYPLNLYKSKKYKEWVSELNRASPIDNYFFFEVKLKDNDGIKFEIK